MVRVVQYVLDPETHDEVANHLLCDDKGSITKPSGPGGYFRVSWESLVLYR